MTYVSCGNPAIIRYFKPDIGQAGTYTEARINPVNKQYLIYEKNNVRIFIKNVTQNDFAEALFFSGSRNSNFRIPSLTYIKFIVENKSGLPFTVNFYKATLSGSSGNIYKTVSKKQTHKIFTSVAYTNFTYTNVFSMYQILYNDRVPDRGTFYERSQPGKAAIIRPGYTGTQIVPFDRVFEGSPEFRLELGLGPQKENGEKSKIEVSLHYIVIRSDMPDLMETKPN